VKRERKLTPDQNGIGPGGDPFGEQQLVQ